MQAKQEKWTDERIERVVGLLLRIGVMSASAVVVAGGILYLFQYGLDVPRYEFFQGEPLRLRTVSGILASAFALESRGIIQLGLLLLILTPIARVAFSVAAFAIERDRLYVSVTLIVLAVLLYNLLQA